MTTLLLEGIRRQMMLGYEDKKLKGYNWTETKLRRQYFSAYRDIPNVFPDDYHISILRILLPTHLLEADIDA